MRVKIDVLDHGFVRGIDHMGSDLSIVRNARVSYDAEWRTGEDWGSDRNLIGYLLDKGHNTPFEAVTFTFEVMAPIFVLRQWHRHRTQSYNELSSRYKELPELAYVPEAGLIGVQSKGNKQCRDIDSNLTLGERESAEQVRVLIDSSHKLAFEEYRELLRLGTPRELARLVLPVATYSHMFATMNLHNLFGFLRERLHDHAQYEIRMYAWALLQLISNVVPTSVSFFIDSLGSETGYSIIERAKW